MENTRLACVANVGGRKRKLILPTTRLAHHTLLRILNKANPRISTNLPAVGLQFGSAFTDLQFLSVRNMLLLLLLYFRYIVIIAVIVVFIVYACVIVTVDVVVYYYYCCS